MTSRLVHGMYPGGMQEIKSLMEWLDACHFQLPTFQHDWWWIDVDGTWHATLAQPLTVVLIWCCSIPPTRQVKDWYSWRAQLSVSLCWSLYQSRWCHPAHLKQLSLLHNVLQCCTVPFMHPPKAPGQKRMSGYLPTHTSGWGVFYSTVLFAWLETLTVYTCSVR